MQQIKDLSKSRRFAILLSNTDAEGLPTLTGRTKNATSLGETLKEKGFEVVCHEENLTTDGMTQAVDFFLAYVKDALTVTKQEDQEITTLFYFSGYVGRSVDEDATVVYDKEGKEYAFHRHYLETITQLKGAHLLMMDTVNKPLVTESTYFKSHLSLGTTSLFIFALTSPYEKQPPTHQLELSPFTQCLVSILSSLDNTEVEVVAKLAQIELNRLYPVLSFYCMRYSSLTHHFCFRRETQDMVFEDGTILTLPVLTKKETEELVY